MKLSGWGLVLALLFAGGAWGAVLSALIVRGAFQAGVKIGAAPFEKLHITDGSGTCEQAEATVKR